MFNAEKHWRSEQKQRKIKKETSACNFLLVIFEAKEPQWNHFARTLICFPWNNNWAMNVFYDFVFAKFINKKIPKIWTFFYLRFTLVRVAKV